MTHPVPAAVLPRQDGRTFLRCRGCGNILGALIGGRFVMSVSLRAGARRALSCDPAGVSVICEHCGREWRSAAEGGTDE